MISPCIDTHRYAQIYNFTTFYWLYEFAYMGKYIHAVCVYNIYTRTDTPTSALTIDFTRSRPASPREVSIDYGVFLSFFANFQVISAVIVERHFSETLAYAQLPLYHACRHIAKHKRITFLCISLYIFLVPYCTYAYIHTNEGIIGHLKCYKCKYTHIHKSASIYTIPEPQHPHTYTSLSTH